MRFRNFFTKLINVLLLAGVLFYYQSVAVQRAEAVEANRAAVAEAEAYNDAIRLENEAAERAARGFDRADCIEIRRSAAFRPLQVHNVDVRCAEAGKVFRDLRRVFAVNGHLRVIALVEAHRFALIQVNGWKNVHRKNPFFLFVS